MKRTQNKEEIFHDNWARTENLSVIDVKQINEALTAPEMRFISSILNQLPGNKILDVGCGLGEASVYFATLGYDVTAVDISNEMLNALLELADLNNVKVRTHKSTAEELTIDENEEFDMIYVGNLFHHVDISKTLEQLKKHLNPNGFLVSWDPLAYNPIINVYRKIATNVRTDDEHPFTIKDIRLFKKSFRYVKIKYFWFTTLIIFIMMYVFQRRNPSQERYWKKVVQESNHWAWIYRPLEYLDKILLFIFPPLKLLCWNIVIVSSNPICRVKNGPST